MKYHNRYLYGNDEEKQLTGGDILNFIIEHKLVQADDEGACAWDEYSSQKLDAKAIEIMNNLKSDIENKINEGQQTKINPTVIEIVKEYLKANGYDGLCTSSCGCSIEDMPLCEHIYDDCCAAYKVISPTHDTYFCPNKTDKPCEGEG